MSSSRYGDDLRHLRSLVARICEDARDEGKQTAHFESLKGSASYRE